MSNQIDVSNPNAITYCTEEIGFTILGGIRMDGLDRLRVTIRIEVINRKIEYYMNNPEIAALPVNHNLDLYNDVQVEKLILPPWFVSSRNMGAKVNKVLSQHRPHNGVSMQCE